MPPELQDPTISVHNQGGNADIFIGFSACSNIVSCKILFWLCVCIDITSVFFVTVMRICLMDVVVDVFCVLESKNYVDVLKVILVCVISVMQKNSCRLFRLQQDWLLFSSLRLCLNQLKSYFVW